YELVTGVQTCALPISGDVHHLLLVDDDAVGLFENRLELGQQVGDFHLAVLALHVLVNEATLQRSGAEECVRGGDVIEGGWSHVRSEGRRGGKGWRRAR